jgi:hypothetical protein
MAVFLVCAKCDEMTVIEHLPVEACPQCGTPYPTQARLAAEAALIRSEATKPGLLVVGQMLSAMGGGILLAVCGLAAIGRGQLTLFGESVTGGQFLERAGPVFGSVGVVLSLVAIGLSRNKRWARPLMLLVWLIPVTEGLVRIAMGKFESDILIVPFVLSIIALPMAYVYLYRRDPVKRYFDGPHGPTPNP